jgi:hypothetical protein
MTGDAGVLFVGIRWTDIVFSVYMLHRPTSALGDHFGGRRRWPRLQLWQ